MQSAPSNVPHVARYLGRVDDRLRTTADPAEQRRFLADEIDKWEHRYGQFQSKVVAGRNTDPEVTAFDYVETISALGQRMPRMTLPHPWEQP